MFETLEKIGQFISALFDVAFMLIDGLMKFLDYLSEIATSLPSYLTLFPSVLTTGVMAIFAISITYLIIGRRT